MAARQWRQRMLSATRGRVLTLLRRGPGTVNELAGALGLTDNAVRLHLASLERDGLIEQEGVRRGAGKPAFVYRLTEGAEALFPKAYGALLKEVLAQVRAAQGAESLSRLLRAAGRSAGERAAASDPTLRGRVDAAVVVLGELGGLAEVEETADAITIRGMSCPIGSLVAETPEACQLAEELVSAVVGAEVTECCDRSGRPKCAFRVART